ncbi:GspH/FimT family pseudopilin [Vibrio vulnificus]|uniref:pilus assembly FimT family protein n=1 Tax=Vibrio vulnificus TaxID=672 RepID=UPI0013EE87D1|nr:GspH/FimT family pseudopilin [Vibrio vulnificus]EIO4079100.1 GspH/FimT family pseudopilin [Vibrio vulnificus]ELV8688482.1 GspH/FimT family pseudopilin [Vibrio vulnificus]MCA3882984.1 GspH/FimT family pseudopilin [Vibrio vulnificus]MCA3949311.1 GspH/FimT family pseudopilin [Vibrio vulnificus]MCU8190212.1 GspH/FimT family pseudopilin [Vibrio vulnificus]
MKNGFTLLELLITVTVLGILIAFSAPNFGQMSVKVKLKNLHEELADMVMMSRSEAVSRNTSVYLHFLGLEKNVSNKNGSFCLIVSLSATVANCNDGTGKLYITSGEPFRGLEVTRTNEKSVIKFNRVNGRPDDIAAGSAEFEKILDAGDANLSKIDFRMSGIGIVRACDPTGASSQYKMC